MPFRFKYLIILIASILSPNAFSQYKSYIWDKNPDALFYKGIVKTNGKTMTFQTKNNGIILSKDSKLTVFIYTPYQKIEVKKFKIKEINKPTKKILKKIESGFYAEFTEQEEIEDEREEIHLEPKSPITLTREEQELEELQQKQSKAFDIIPYRLLLLNLEIGKERIEANGGVNSFKGNSTIGGTALELIFDLDRDQTTSPWEITLKAKGHNFTTKQYNESAEDEEQNSTTSYRFINASIGFLYDTISSQNFDFKFGFSYLSFDSAKMNVINQITAESELEVITNAGLKADIAALWKISATNEIEINLNQSIYNFRGDENAKIMQSNLNWRNFILPQFFSQISIGITEQSNKYDSFCPEGLNTCISNGESNTKTSLTKIGVGALF